MSDPLNAQLPQDQAVTAVARPLGRMPTIYVGGFAFVVCLQLLGHLLEVSKRGLNVSPTHVAALATAAVLAPVLLAIPAGLITAIGALWVKKGRGRLFMRSHFYLMVFLIPMAVIGQLASLYALD